MSYLVLKERSFDANHLQDTARSILQELCSNFKDPTLNSRIEALIKAVEKISAVRENLDIQTEYGELDELGTCKKS